MGPLAVPAQAASAWFSALFRRAGAAGQEVQEAAGGDAAALGPRRGRQVRPVSVFNAYLSCPPTIFHNIQTLVFKVNN